MASVKAIGLPSSMWDIIRNAPDGRIRPIPDPDPEQIILWDWRNNRAVTWWGEEVVLGKYRCVLGIDEETGEEIRWMASYSPVTGEVVRYVTLQKAERVTGPTGGDWHVTDEGVYSVAGQHSFYTEFRRLRLEPM